MESSAGIDELFSRKPTPHPAYGASKKTTTAQTIMRPIFREDWELLKLGTLETALIYRGIIRGFIGYMEKMGNRLRCESSLVGGRQAEIGFEVDIPQLLDF